MADYGSDFSTFWRADKVPDLDPTFTVVTGPRNVAECIARRLITPRGGLLRAPNYGFDVRQYVGIKLTAAKMIELKSGIREQCLAEERVISVALSVAQDLVAHTLTISIELELSDGTFEFTLVIDSLTATILDGTA